MAFERELDGQMAIVTGATRGIGRAIARRLAQAGAAVVVTGRDVARVEAAAADIRSRGGRALGLAADHGEAADWARVVEAAEAQFTAIDILVANAGIADPMPIVDMSLETFRGLTRTNLRGCFLGLKAVAATMVRRGSGGSIILMSSIVGKVGAPGHAAYAAAKDGVRLMAKAAALELGGDRIRVNSIHPGMVRTAMTAPYEENQFAQAIPLGRFGEPDEVAAAAVFLASSRSKFMTGAELVIDGGWIAR